MIGHKHCYQLDWIWIGFGFDNYDNWIIMIIMIGLDLVGIIIIHDITNYAGHNYRYWILNILILKRDSNGTDYQSSIGSGSKLGAPRLDDIPLVVARALEYPA